MSNEALEWDYADDAVGEGQIVNIGKSLGFNFPKDYIECVKINGGASVYPEAFYVEGIEREFGSLLSFNEQSIENVINSYKTYKDSLPEKVFPFADDPAGNLICFDYKDHEDDPIVVFWEHENAAEKSMLIRDEGMTEEEAEKTARENVFYIADSFTDFLNKLHD